MKLIVGLGNPGPEYALTPHNAGFLAIDRIADLCGVPVANLRCRAFTGRAKLAGHDILLAKPITFMNDSGLAVAALLQDLQLQVEDMMVLYDELAFPLGTVRMAQRGSAAGHNGVKSISALLGTEEWLRVRIGIGRPPVDGRTIRAGGKDFLLSPLRKPQLAQLDEALDHAVRAVEVVLTKGVSAAMNEVNTRVVRE